MSFDRSVFINCPFDKDYRPLLDAMLFTIVYLEHEPLISETVDSGIERMNSIQNLIRQAKYSIHDLSRMEAHAAGDLPRFNMPFELGVDFGCRLYGGGNLESKMFLVLEKENHRYHATLSDLSGKDIESHGNKPKTLVRKVRNWLGKIYNEKLIGPDKIWEGYNEFLSYLSITLEDEGFDADDIEDLSRSDFIRYIKDWISARAAL
ncbi:MAG: hypothetical protein LH606_13380 [Cytophagaceae bacterium]|nr:hypothetical protein [Cytophagaceae bacterium]